MDDVGSVQEVDGAKEVVQYDFGMLHVERNVLILVENLCQILVDVAHDQEDASWVLLGVLTGLSGNDDINELDCEDIVLHLGEAAQNCYFSVDSLDAVDAVEGVGDVFDGYSLLGRLVGCLDYLPEAALTLNFVELEVIGEASPGGWQALQKLP